MDTNQEQGEQIRERDSNEGSFFHKHFCRVTPLSKYLAMLLFILMPFFGFWLGLQYADQCTPHSAPIIANTATNTQSVNTNSNSSTVTIIEDNSEAGEITLSGEVVPGGQDSCPVDGVCSLMVGEYEVEWAHGWANEVSGSMDDVIEVGDVVRVYGKKTGPRYITIYGSEDYYIKKIDDETYKVELHISNQSFAIDPVDVHITVDDEVVVNEVFYVGTQHSYKSYNLTLTPGEHVVRIESQNGNASFEGSFEVTGQHTAIVHYNYNPKGSGPNYETDPYIDFNFGEWKPLAID